MIEINAGWEMTVRLSAFIGIFAVMATWEILAPRRPLSQSKPQRWFNNLSLVVLNTLILRLVFPAAAVGMADLAIQNQWGLFNQLHVPYPLAVLAAVVILDAAIYFQHIMLHAVPALWRLHRVHHADLDFDVTTGSRFHPLEILLSMLIKFAVILLIGPPLLAVLIFEVLLNATSMFNHSNIRMPLAFDRVVRWFIVTPDMHRVHHSHLPHETNSNFGFNLSIWDRVFGTYRSQPQDGHLGMTIGIDTFRDAWHCIKLPGLLLLPFIGKVRAYALNSRDGGRNENPS